MMFGIFGRAKRPPLTEFCMKLSTPERMLATANSMYEPASSKQVKHATVLSLVIMSAAGNLVENLRWDQTKMWRGSQQYLRDTNLDVIAAEALIWVYFLMRKFYDNEIEKEYQRRRAGHTRTSPWLHVDEHAFHLARLLVLEIIHGQTGFDFSKQRSNASAVMTQR
jgi:hypothetical protein